MNKSKLKHVCGIVLCVTCNAQFGINSCSYKKCIFHFPENADISKAKKRKVSNSSHFYPAGPYYKLIHQNYRDLCKRAKENDDCFFNSKYESFDDSSDEIACRHCILRDKGIDSSCFQKVFVMMKNPKSEMICKVINNRYELKNYHALKKLCSSSESECLVKSSSTCKHDLFFDENLGNPSTLFQNSIFGIRPVEGFGDCGILSILLPILSSKESIQKEIYKNMHEFHKEKDGSTKDIPMEDFFTVKGIRSFLFYAKMNAEKNQDFDFMEMDEMSKVFCKFNSSESKSDKAQHKDELRSCFIRSNEDDLDPQNIYWLTPNDMFNLLHATGGLLGVIFVLESSRQIQTNSFDEIVTDLGYYALYEKHILKEAKYFIFLRYVDQEHFDFFYDRRTKNAMFEANDSQENSPLRQILKLCNPHTRYTLAGRTKDFNESYPYQEDLKYYITPPKFKDWCAKIDRNETLFVEKKYFPWIQQSITNTFDDLHKKEGKEIPMLLFGNKMKEEPSLDLLNYVKWHENKPIILDCKKQRMYYNDIQALCKKYKYLGLEHVEALLESQNLRRPTTAEVKLCSQFVCYSIFCAKVHKCGALHHNFYDSYFGCDQFELQNIDFLKEACRVLIQKYHDHPNKKLLFQMYLVYNKDNDEKTIFDMLYTKTEANKKDEWSKFDSWFYRNNEEFQLKYIRGTDTYPTYSVSANASYHDTQSSPTFLLLNNIEVQYYWNHLLRHNKRKKHDIANTFHKRFEELSDITNYNLYRKFKKKKEDHFSHGIHCNG